MAMLGNLNINAGRGLGHLARQNKPNSIPGVFPLIPPCTVVWCKVAAT